MKPPRRYLVRQTLGVATTVYAVRDPDADYSEPDRFFLDPNVQASSDYRALANRLRRSGPQQGFSDHWFRSERKVWALYAPHPDGAPELEDVFPPQLRLYCLRLFQGRILVAGHGGVKRTRTFQQDPVLNAAVRDLEALGARIEARIKLGDIEFSDLNGFPALTGSLSFDPDDIP